MLISFTHFAFDTLLYSDSMVGYGWKVLRVDAPIDSLRAANEIKYDQINMLELFATPLCSSHGAS